MYLYLKAIHIIAVVAWFAGLFYIVRLFIYHIEAQQKQESEKKVLISQFEIMEKRLWKAITTPAMILTVLSGSVLIYYHDIAKEPWLHLKFTLLLFLFHYHFKCGAILKKLSKGTYQGSSKKLRIFNEIASLLLVAIVFTAVTKSLVSAAYGFGGFLILMIILVIFFRKRLQGTKDDLVPK